MISSLLEIVKISIHAPAKGATFYALRIGDVETDFNPRSREGSDGQSLLAQAPPAFQSTLPRRERHIDTGFDTGAIFISIHAPAKGAT